MTKSSKKPATIVDVAKEAGVSYSTVSRVINNKYGVKEETRALVWEAAKRLNYHANLQARVLKGGRTQIIATTVHAVGIAYFENIIYGVDSTLHPHNYNLWLFTTHRKKEKEKEFVLTVSTGLADGVILITPEAIEEYLPILRQMNYPFVLVDHTGFLPSDPTVTANETSAYQAMEHLIELGHKKIAFIEGIPHEPTAIKRKKSYMQALQDHELWVNLDWSVIGNYTQDGGYDATKKLLETTPRPTAILACNDRSALGAISAITQAGLRVPEDISIVGIDDVMEASISTPPLTTIRRPLREMGQKAAEMLIDLLNDKPVENAVLPTKLIIRQSTMPPSAEEA